MDFHDIQEVGGPWTAEELSYFWKTLAFGVKVGVRASAPAGMTCGVARYGLYMVFTESCHSNIDAVIWWLTIRGLAYVSNNCPTKPIPGPVLSTDTQNRPVRAAWSYISR